MTKHYFQAGAGHGAGHGTGHSLTEGDQHQGEQGGDVCGHIGSGADHLEIGRGWQNYGFGWW